MKINKIYNENCIDTMSRMKDGLIDLTVTSPPYDNLRTYNGYSFDFESVAKELYRVTKQGGVVVWNVNDSTVDGSETLTSFKQALFFKDIGFNVHDTMIYDKGFAKFPDSVRYGQSFEYMFVFSKGKPNTFNPIQEFSKRFGRNSVISDREKDGKTKSKKVKVNETKNKRNVWHIDSGFNRSTKDVIAYNHPAIFPEKLAYDHIKTWTNENDIVYDCFMGSGTTAKACISSSRKWIGSEISKEYCEIIEKRLEPLRHNLFT
tara:strand:+ start:1007 stop:1789 length:783 start_codon:yes stop_codon:yes gene_type:complete